MGSLAIALHRQSDHPTDEVIWWLKRREWKIITMASGAMMASPPDDERGVFTLMDAVLRQVIREREAERWGHGELPRGRRVKLGGNTPPAPKPSRRDRLKDEPENDEDLFR